MGSIQHRELADRLLIQLHEGNNLFVYGPHRSGKSSLLQYFQTLHPESSLIIDMKNASDSDLFSGNLSGLAQALVEAGYAQEKQFLLLIDNVHLAAHILPHLNDLNPSIQCILTSEDKALAFDERGSLLNGFLTFPLLPLNFREYLRFRNEEELLASLPDEPFAVSSPLSDQSARKLKEHFERFLRFGGYPETVFMEEDEISGSFFPDMILPHIMKDIPAYFGIRKKKDFIAFFNYLNTLQGQPFNEAAAARDMGHRFETIEVWKQILENFSLIHRIHPWHHENPNEIRKFDRIYLWDTGLRNALITNFNPPMLRLDGEVLLQQYCAATFSQSPQWECHYWQTKQGQALDFLLINDFDSLPVDVKIHSQKPSYIPRYCRHHGLDRGIIITADRFGSASAMESIPAYLI